MKLKNHAVAAALVTLSVSAAVTLTIFFAARSTGNNDEFFDALSGAPTSDLYLLLAVWFVAATVAAFIPMAVLYWLFVALFRMARGNHRRLLSR